MTAIWWIFPLLIESTEQLNVQLGVDDIERASGRDLSFMMNDNLGDRVISESFSLSSSHITHSMSSRSISFAKTLPQNATTDTLAVDHRLGLIHDKSSGDLIKNMHGSHHRNLRPAIPRQNPLRSPRMMRRQAVQQRSELSDQSSNSTNHEDKPRRSVIKMIHTGHTNAVLWIAPRADGRHNVTCVVVLGVSLLIGIVVLLTVSMMMRWINE